MNIAKTQLIMAKVSINVDTHDAGFGFSSKFIPVVINRSMMLDTGPASDTKAVSLSLFSKLYSFTGTGLLHPNLNIIIEIAPNGSMWERGFRVNLPFALAVRSPNFIADQACAYSCTVEAISIEGMAKSIQYIVSGVKKFIPYYTNLKK